ncbi:hypothetical protein GCM10010326_00820 [Streptomyces xanthochromogenes]|uniref:Transposase n=1 Tax=Streptomyces xanthochromogenes TaxID=67384 RepID=A0ABQ2ZH69_9ACTN|nr:hypothetical protein GCM10010326_00820 [Streptomyces xanthochromogenes]
MARGLGINYAASGPRSSQRSTHERKTSGTKTTDGQGVRTEGGERPMATGVTPPTKGGWVPDMGVLELRAVPQR